MVFQTKQKYAHEDAITDDAAGQAYIEQFAQERLDAAERVVKANKVTQQTAVTFDAAATFFHLVNIWGPPDTETQQKIKYAKWNAARIAKAIREGKDPNESNPKHEDAEPEQALDQNDPEVQALNSSTAPAPSHLQPTVEDAPDSDARSELRDAAGVSLPHSPASAAPSADLQLPGVPTHIGGHDLPPPQQSQPGYFDNSMPSPISPQPPVTQHQPSAPSSTRAASPPPPAPPVPAPEDLYRSAPPPTFQPPPAARPPVSAATAPRPTGQFTTDEAAMVQAQKHAKWAISALNFEDVNTAVMELRKALESLGAR